MDSWDLCCLRQRETLAERLMPLFLLQDIGCPSWGDSPTPLTLGQHAWPCDLLWPMKCEYKGRGTSQQKLEGPCPAHCFLLLSMWIPEASLSGGQWDHDFMTSGTGGRVRTCLWSFKCVWRLCVPKTKSNSPNRHASDFLVDSFVKSELSDSHSQGPASPGGSSARLVKCMETRGCAG